MDSIHISGIELMCIVGIRPAERRRRQRIRLSVELEVDLARAGVTERIANSVDYSVVTDEIAQLLRFRQYRLVETATEEVSAMLLGVHPTVERVSVTLEKPEALRGRAAWGGVSISRSRRSSRTAPEPYGASELLLETAEATLFLHHVEPGHSLAERAPRDTPRLGWLVSGQLGEKPVVSHHDPRELDRILTVKNHAGERATVFLCGLSRPESA
jgi:FolB domain-containing protein